eukprot:scaffold7852_cov277-Pinguiococcus_pyrenoidosus.AAC.3
MTTRRTDRVGGNYLGQENCGILPDRCLRRVFASIVRKGTDDAINSFHLPRQTASSTLTCLPQPAVPSTNLG